MKKKNSSRLKAGTAKFPGSKRPFPAVGIRCDRIAGLALILIALGIAWGTFKLPLGSLHDPGPGYMPLLLAITLGGFGLIVVLCGASSPLFRSQRWAELPHALKILLACVFAALALERLGYRLTVIILLVFLLGVMERQRPVMVAAVALGFSFGTFFLFSDLLKVPLPRGPWGF